MKESVLNSSHRRPVLNKVLSLGMVRLLSAVFLMGAALLLPKESSAANESVYALRMRRSILIVEDALVKLNVCFTPQSEPSLQCVRPPALSLLVGFVALDDAVAKLEREGLVISSSLITQLSNLGQRLFPRRNSAAVAVRHKSKAMRLRRFARFTSEMELRRIFGAISAEALCIERIVRGGGVRS